MTEAVNASKSLARFATRRRWFGSKNASRFPKNIKKTLFIRKDCMGPNDPQNLLHRSAFRQEVVVKHVDDTKSAHCLWSAWLAELGRHCPHYWRRLV